MQKELWLLRHGKSDRETDLADIDRPLKKRGEKNAFEMGSWMKQNQLIPELIITSPAKRAYDTACIVAEAMHGNPDHIVVDKRVYFQGIEAIKNVLSEAGLTSHKILIVGHNPDLENLVEELVGFEHLPEAKKLMPTATLVRLLLEDDISNISAGTVKLLAIMRPKDLP
ncbi:MAG: phosphohistidine phosphatase SixA [Methylococcaceae bacterium]|nr:MAG: phosphohistidine phosphatase SixA [Methylococcaceae bacterium]